VSAEEHFEVSRQYKAGLERGEAVELETRVEEWGCIAPPSRARLLRSKFSRIDTTMRLCQLYDKALLTMQDLVVIQATE